MPLITQVPYTEALELYHHVIPHTGDGAPIQVLVDPVQIKKWERETGDRPLCFVITSPTSPVVVFFHAARRLGGTPMVFQQVARTEVHRGRGIILFPLWNDLQGMDRVVLVKHERPALAMYGFDHGGGWELEVPSFGQRAGKTILESIQEEAVAEGNFRIIGDPIRLDGEGSPGCPMLPGITSELAQIWFARVELNEGDPREDQEGIVGRVCCTKEEFNELLGKGVVELQGQFFLTGLFHNLVAAHFAALQGVW
ncbi:MAG: hypothetical protein HYS52_01980 [Candidatus Wildermuthbacteria bacterium]|nr:hypothetical protein [Candidatus Wildermuthbacteria bacterium]